MANSVIVVTGNGVTRQFAVNFTMDYLLQADVTCRVGTEAAGDGSPIYRSLTFLSTNLIQVEGAIPGAGVPIVFERTVDKASLRVNFSNGDQLDEDNLTIAQKQLMMAIHEVMDGRVKQFVDLDVANHRIVNVSTPIAASDAATKGYVDTRDNAVLADNAAKQAAISADNAATLAAVLADNTSTRSTILADNASTLASVQVIGNAATASKNAAAASATSAASTFTDFNKLFLGAKNFDPTVDNDGNPLLDGALFWRIGAGLKAYNATTTTWGLYNPGLGTATVFGRSGNVVAADGDYTASQILNAALGSISATTIQAAINELANRPRMEGRLTLQSGVSVPRTDQIAKTHVYFTNHKGQFCSTYSVAGGWKTHKFTELDLNLAGSANFPKATLFDVFLIEVAGVPTLATRAWDAGMFWTEALITPNNVLAAPPSTPGYIMTGTGATAWNGQLQVMNGVTAATLASGNFGIVGPANAGYANSFGQFFGTGVRKLLSSVKIFCVSDAFLYGGKTSPQQSISLEGSNNGIDWHFMSIIRVDDSAMGGVFTIPTSLTERSGWDYVKINVDGWTGGSSIRIAELQFFEPIAPAAGRRIAYKDGRPVNDATVTMRTAAGATVSVPQFEGALLGTFKTDAATDGAVTVHNSFGPARLCNLSNFYNTVPKLITCGTYSTIKLYTPPTHQRWNVCESALQGDNFSISYVQCMDEEWVVADLLRNHVLGTQVAAASYECGIGIDTKLTFSGTEGTCNIDSTGQYIGFQPKASCSVPPIYGSRTLYALERQGNDGAGDNIASTGPRETRFLAQLSY